MEISLADFPASEEEDEAILPDSSTAAAAAVAQISPSNDTTISSAPSPSSAFDNTAGEDVLLKARNLMRRITAARLSPHPRFLHTLAVIMEQEEDRFQQETGYLSSNNSRSSHTIGRLTNLIRENDDFFELLSSKLLVDTKHSIAVRAAAARLLLSCLTCGTFPDVFEEDVLSNVKQWVVEDYPKLSDGLSPKKFKNIGAAKERKFEHGDWEMLKTYSTGLLALALGAGGGVVEDLLASGIAGKLMHYLRSRVLKDSTSQKDIAHLSVENRFCSSTTTIKSREEGRNSVRFCLELPGAENLNRGEQSVKGQVVPNERPRLLKSEFTDETSCKQDSLEGCRTTPEVPTEIAAYAYDADTDTDWISDEKKRKKEWWEAKSREADWNSSRFAGKDEIKETGNEELSKRRDGCDRGGLEIRGKSKIVDAPESEKFPTSSGIPIINQQEKSGEFRCNTKTDTGSETNTRAGESDTCNDVDFLEDRYRHEQRSMVGDLDIFASVEKAAKAAESEAKAAKAPIAAIKAAKEAAAELVRVAAMESLSFSNDKEAALAAAAAAAKTVVDAAIATQALMMDLGHDNNTADHTNVMTASEMNVHDYADLGDCVLDKDSLAKLREKFSIQCLEKIGEYLEVLGPVLHERGVDVCLALLSRESGNYTNSIKEKPILPDVLKLICALAAHRKFAALFVDKGGLLQLLAVPRNHLTHPGISLCLFAFASLQVIMERVCALPTNMVNALVNLALHLIESTQDSARRNAALFFGAAFVFRAILDSFDAQDGLSIMLNLLRNAAALRSGRGSGPSGSSSTTGSRSDRITSTEVLTSSEKQNAYHTCIALRQYFRAHLSMLVDTLRPCKGRSGPRMGRAAYRPLDLSNEAMENIVLQLQKDRKLGPAFVRARWPALEKFMSFNGHLVLLELVQVAPGERYLYESAQHALGILQIVTLMPFTRRHIVGCSLSNGRSGMAVILDAASIAGFADAEVIQPALLVLVNLVCPPPSVCSRPISQQGESAADNKIGERTGAVPLGQPLSVSSVQSPASGLVGDKRICLGSGAGGSGLAAHMEQGYRQAREAVRANNGIKVLLHLLYPRTVLPPPSLDCIRALACRVLLGLARDDVIAHILTKLQVGKVLSELLRDGNSHSGCSAGMNCISGEQGRWQAELGRVAMELIAIVTNAGRASSLVTSDAAAPTLRRIERAAIAAATPISYHPRELLQLIHEHLAASGLSMTADILLKEAQLVPLSPLLAPVKISNQMTPINIHMEHWHWPTGRVPGGFLAKSQSYIGDEARFKIDQLQGSVRKRYPTFSTSLISSNKTPQLSPLTVKGTLAAKDTAYDHQTSVTPRIGNMEATKRKASDKDISLLPTFKRVALSEFTGSSAFVTPLRLKSSPLVANCSLASGNFSGHQCESPRKVPGHPTMVLISESLDSTAVQNVDNVPVDSHVQDYGTLDHLHASGLGFGTLQLDSHPLQNECATLDSLVVQYLKHQHRQCPVPITTLPPLSLFHPHICPEPSRARYAPLNTASRLTMREIFPPHGGTQGHKRDRHLVYSRFRPWRTCREEGVLLTCNTFLAGAFRVAAGSHGGGICIFDCNSGNVIETHVCHQSPISLLQASPVELTSGIECVGSYPAQLLLSSGSNDVRLWNSSTLSEGPTNSFEGCRSARFNHGGHKFATVSSESLQREVLIYDVQTCKMDNRLSDNLLNSAGLLRGHGLHTVHFNPADTLLLWNGVLWDYRIPRSVHKFDQFSDYGGGGFHPAGNEIIINSEVWDLRSFKLLRSVPSLDQTVLTFSGTGDIIYATLRRNAEDIMSAFHHRRSRHALFAAFRTMDAVDYTDIAMTPVDRCVLDLATESSNSLISVVAMDSTDEMDSFVKLYEVGRRRPTEDDSDPDDGLESEDEDTEIDEATEDLPDDGDETDLDGSNDDNDASGDGDEPEQEGDAELDSNDDGDDGDDDVIDVGEGILEIVTEGEEDETGVSYSSDDEDDDVSSGDFDEDFNDVLHGFF